MRILHIVPSYLPAVRYGGPIVAVHGLARALARAGHQVEVFTTNIDGRGVSDVPVNEDVVLDGVRIRYFAAPFLARLYFSPRLAARCRSVVKAFDLVHLHSAFLYPPMAAARAASVAGVPYIVSPRGMLVKELIRTRSSIAKRLWIAAFERRTLSNAAAIHVTSNSEGAALDELELSLAPIEVIGNGVDEPRQFDMKDVSSDVRAALAEKIDVLSFGRINWKKGLETLVRSLTRLPNIKAVIAGNDEENYGSALMALARECGIAARVTFLRRQLNGADKEALFAAASVVAIPSISENFGNVVLEAMIRGRPVAVTEGVGAAEIVRKSGGGLVSGNDEQEFAACLARLLNSENNPAVLGRAGAAYVREHFSWARIVPQYEALYRRVMRPQETVAVEPTLSGVA